MPIQQDPQTISMDPMFNDANLWAPLPDFQIPGVQGQQTPNPFQITMPPPPQQQTQPFPNPAGGINSGVGPGGPDLQLPDPWSKLFEDMGFFQLNPAPGSVSMTGTGGYDINSGLPAPVGTSFLGQVNPQAQPSGGFGATVTTQDFPPNPYDAPQFDPGYFDPGDYYGADFYGGGATPF